ncbi:hypothetical protein FACS1894122_09540 [Alphaproteobacteria bacterium]|nr:hypothetical protein FACS1894122_09540 [Alphaproteobacteria bacterium]
MLSKEEEAICVAFRKHSLLPLDDCLYALQKTIPHLSRSSLHRLFQRNNISVLPQKATKKRVKQKFADYEIGYFHVDITEIYSEEGKLYLLDFLIKISYRILLLKEGRITVDISPKETDNPVEYLKKFYWNIALLTRKRFFLLT